MKLFIGCILAACIAVVAGGCASPNVNPHSARAGMGYVDFYTADTNGLFWQVTDIKLNQTLFSQFSNLGGPILRLEFKPGHYQLQVTFLNRVIDTPGTVEVDVLDGMITPVKVTLAPSGTTLVPSSRVQAGGTFYGRWGRRTTISNNQTATFEVSAEPQPPLPYQPKAQMPYNHAIVPPRG